MDGIDHHQPRLDFFDVIENAFQRSFAQHKQVRRFDTEPFGTHLNLPLGFFAGNVETSEVFPAYRGNRLEQKRRLADARIAADKDHRPGYQAAAEHAIEFADARENTAFLGGIDFVDRRRIFFRSQA